MGGKKEKKKMSIMSKILIGFGLGIAAGLIFGEKITVIQPIGTIFIRLLQMLVVPLIFTSLAVGMSSIGDTKKMGRVGGKTLILIVITTIMSTVIGLGLALIIYPGLGVEVQMDFANEVVVQTPSFMETIIDIVPTNIVKSMTEGNVLQIILFAVILGIALVRMGEPGEPLIKVLDSIANAMYEITNIVIGFAPIGVFALIASVVGAQGYQILISLGKLLLTVYLGCFLTLLLVNGVFTVGVLGKMGVKEFFKSFKEAMIFSFVTGSSSATLPVSIKCTTENMGVSHDIASFVQPLGATMNMNGTSLYQGICVVFIAQVSGVDLSMGELLTIVFTALLAAVGTAGVNGAGLIMLTMVLTSVGLPVESIALVAGVDRLLEAARCVPNVTGDAAMAVVIAKQENELDEDIYYGRKKYVKEEVEVL